VASISAVEVPNSFILIWGFKMKSVSTREASRKLGISLISVQRYIAAKRITAPKLQKIGGVRLRLWTDRDIKRVRRQLPGIKNWRSKRKA
jgi:transposase